MNLNSILIGSDDADRLVVYYGRLFGPPTWDVGPYKGWQIGTGGLVVGPHDQVHGRNQEAGRIIWNIESPDVRSDFDRLVAAGATVVREPYNPAEDGTGNALIATFSDPDGNYFQLTSPM